MEVHGITLTPQEEQQWKEFNPESFAEALNDEENGYDLNTHTLKDLSYLPEELQDGIAGNGPFDIYLRPSGGEHSQ